jgi:nucleoside-diphosphate-sugar epimerase
MARVVVVTSPGDALVNRLQTAFAGRQLDATFVDGSDSFILDRLDGVATLVVLCPVSTDLLHVAGERGVRQVVVVSSAMVYGAWPNNPVPLTETALLRPPDSYRPVVELAIDLEERVQRWGEASGCAVCVLRPALAMAAEGTPAVVRALAAGVGRRAGEEDPPAQFLHLDDLVSAVLTVVTTRAEGVYNVAPDGWISGEVMRGLTASPARLRLPGWIADAVGAFRWMLQRGPLPPGLRDYTRWPWVVSNDALKSLGWAPTFTNEQAYVEGTETPWYAMMSPKRRQEVALGASFGLIILVIAVLVRRTKRWR